MIVYTTENMIIDTNVKYNSNLLKTDINSLLLHYSFLDLITIGHSVLEKPIYCIKLGFGSKKIFYFGSIHANEWICTNLLMKFIEDMCVAYNRNTTIYGYNVRDLLNTTSVYIVPMANPDGVDLVNGNINFNSNEYFYAKNTANLYPSIPFPSGWKANIHGVDLNLQFPAGWEQAREIKYSQGFTAPAPRDFVGFAPLTEPEALALYNFTLLNDFRLILAYHTQGQEIYWQFRNYATPDAYNIGLELAKASGYTLANVPYESSFAGYKDWFLQQYGRPGYTIEAGLGKNPLPLSQFNKIYNDNIGILILSAIL